MRTFEEIAAQPGIWRGHAQRLAAEAAALQGWIARRARREVWLCGAGSSAYIGEALAAGLGRAAPARLRAIPTTALVARPGDYLGEPLVPLVISFGRSGNSSETIAVLDLLDTALPQADRLDITCNASSALGLRAVPGPGEHRRIVLPEATHDQGFAMTASFTTMLLSALACLDLAPPMPPAAALEALAGAAEEVLAGAAALLRGRLATAPERVVFLGSGPLEAIARESALKVLELAAGRIATAWDTPLGFRHGPKALVDARTLVVVNLSHDAHARRYDEDLAAELRAQFGAAAVLTQGAGAADLPIPGIGNDAWSAVLHVLLAQLAAATWSAGFGLDVDNPFAGGTLSRVVAGVRIHPYAG